MKHNQTLFLYDLVYFYSEWNCLENLICHVGSATHTGEIVLVFGETLFPSHNVTSVELFIY